MICPNCGFESSDSVKFCRNCGYQFSQDPTQAQDDAFTPTQPIDNIQQQGQTQEVPSGQYQQGQTQQMPGGQYQQVPPQQPGQSPYQQPIQKQEPSIAPFVLAIIALVTAILGLFPVSIILAIIALVMNSGQKKRGEFSSKQTPTFVMSLISLVLSVIVAIVTIMLGGLIWASLMSSNYSVSTAGSSTTKSKSVSSSTSKSSSSSTSKSSSSASKSSSSNGSYSTTSRPTMSDFGWITGEAAKGNAPSGSKTLTSINDLTGGWKAYMYGEGGEHLFNVSMGGTNGNVLMIFDWYTATINGKDVNEESNPDSTFNGAMAGSSLDATGSGKVTLSAMWEQNGHQYATGSFIWPSGERDNIALVRP